MEKVYIDSNNLLVSKTDALLLQILNICIDIILAFISDVHFDGKCIYSNQIYLLFNRLNNGI